MISFITRFVNYLTHVLNWQVVAFLTVVFAIIGLLKIHADMRRARRTAAGFASASFWPPIVGVFGAILFFAVGLHVTGKLESQKLFKTTTKTVMKECFDCLEKGHFVMGHRYDTTLTAPSGKWFVPIESVKPVVLDKIEFLPVHPAFSDNPRYGFDTRKAFFVVFSDVVSTEELQRQFDDWELLMWSLLFGLVMYGFLSSLEKRFLRTKAFSGRAAGVGSI